MPNTNQAKKRLLQAEKSRKANKVIRTSMRSAMKKVLRADTRTDGETLMPLAQKRIDRAAKQHIIHTNAAARYKARLAKRVAQLG